MWVDNRNADWSKWDIYAYFGWKIVGGVDVSLDGRVDQDDLSHFIAAWGAAHGTPAVVDYACDQDGDGDVDADDVAIFLERWLAESTPTP